MATLLVLRRGSGCGTSAVMTRASILVVHDEEHLKEPQGYIMQHHDGGIVACKQSCRCLGFLATLGLYVWDSCTSADENVKCIIYIFDM